jgi:hypothetical protein
MLNQNLAGPAPAPQPRPWPLTYQIVVNGIILDRQLRPADSGHSLLSESELEALERAYYAGESALAFAERITGARVSSDGLAEMAVVA